MNKTEKAIEVIEYAISMVVEKIENVNTPETGSESKEQLSDFLSILILMKQKLVGEDVGDESRIYNMGHIITDSWPSLNSLGATIMKAEQEYNKVVTRGKQAG